MSLHDLEERNRFGEDRPGAREICGWPRMAGAINNAYCEINPQSPLIASLSVFGVGEHCASTQAERILPDGCVELILNFGAEFSQHTDGKQETQPRNFWWDK